MSQPIHVLMTGAGAPGAAGILQCLREDPYIQVSLADADPNASGRYFGSPFFTLPRADDPGFALRVLELCLENKINTVLPLVTRELLPLATLRADFEKARIRLLLSDLNALRIANNKSESYRHLKEAGLEIPAFHVVRTAEQFIHAAFELGHPQKPFCFKPSASNGSRGVRIVSEAIDEANLLFHEKPYHLYIGYAHALSVLSSRPFPELLVSEYLPGPEYSVDCLANQGQTILALPRRRDRMVNGISVKGIFLEDQRIINYCRQIIQHLGLHGNIGIQVKMDDRDRPRLLEINPRVQGTTVAALGAGVNFPLLAVYQEWGRPLESEKLCVKWGTSFVRHWTEVFY